MKNFEDLRLKIQGPVFSVVVPFKDSDEIDFKKIENYLSYAYKAGARIFYVMGYNSRFSELSWEEIKILNTFVTRHVKSLGEDTIVIVADPLHCSTKVSMEFCKHAESIGADIISLIFREKFYSNTQVVKHFKMCSEAANIGILIHEMPFISGHGGHTVNWPIELLDELADIENIIAIKEDAKDDAYSEEVILKIKDRLSIIISGGGKRQWLRFSKKGCQSWLNGIGVFEPKLAILFWEMYKNSDEKGMEKIITDIEIPFFTEIVKKYGWHLSVKAALQSRGFMSRYERMPLLALDDDTYKNIDKLIKKLPIEKILRESNIKI